MLVAGAEPAVRWRGAGGHQYHHRRRNRFYHGDLHRAGAGTGYTVVIPASVAIPQGETSTTMQISVGAGSTLESGKTLSVKLESSANNFSLKLTGGSDAIGYKVEKDNQAVNAGDAVLSWTGGEAIPAAATLTMALTESTGGKTAGEYSDTLTFKLSLGTTGFNATHDGFEDGDEVDW